MINFYCLKTCDTCRKAVKWLVARGHAPVETCLRKDGVPASVIKAAIADLGWEVVLNKRSTTWRTLSEEEKSDLGPEKAAQLIAKYPILMKRPLIEIDGKFVAGFNASAQAELERLIS